MTLISSLLRSRDQHLLYTGRKMLSIRSIRVPAAEYSRTDRLRIVGKDTMT